MSFGRGDEIAGEVAAADVEETAGDVEWGEWGGPVRALVGAQVGRREDLIECEGAQGREHGSSGESLRPWHGLLQG